MNIRFFDGSMGTMLQSAGLGAGEQPELWNLTHPERVLEIHRAYAAAGSEFITTNTFGANELKTAEPEEVIRAGVRLAKSAGKKVALDIGPTGKLLKPMGELDFERAVEIFARMIRAGRDGSDIVLIETMSDAYELKAAVLAAKENCDLPVFATMIFDEKGRLLTGADVKTAAALLEGLGVDAIGFNCGLGPAETLPLLEELRRCTSLPIIVQPNAGLPESVNGKTVFNVAPDEFAGYMKKAAQLGVSYLGGCCGTTPEHIKEMISACAGIPAAVPEKKSATVVTSYSRAVEIGKTPVIIGERINPTGKKLFKEALRRNDIEHIIKEGLRQTDAGAHILDVNVGLPEIDEAAMMVQAVKSLQSVTPAPLQIDTSDPAVLERALRIYNGKPLINSVNGGEKSMGAVFPLAKKYGGAVVCLCLDDSGIPETAEGRIEIAKRIIKTAAEYGIDKRELIFDALTMTVSTNANAAAETLRAVKMLRGLGVCTVLGVSNISFGLPNRDVINASFFTMALQSGLSAGIINPLSQAMTDAYRAFCALSGSDENCAGYIAYASAAGQKSEKAEQGETTLHAAIVSGVKEDAARCAGQLLKELSPMEVIDAHIIPALDEVGAGFESGRLFLPQLLMSADSAGAAFDVIRAEMEKSGVERERGGKVILATVHGDIHDIGKNIVKALLVNYGFEVTDLGRDVPEEEVVRAVKESGAGFVGLSALMTTTVPAMERTIKLLRESTNAYIVVGGAVLTKAYADMIGADLYCRDAMDTVRAAQAFYGSENQA